MADLNQKNVLRDVFLYLLSVPSCTCQKKVIPLHKIFKSYNYGNLSSAFYANTNIVPDIQS